MSKQGVEIDIGKIILQKLKEKDRSISWLARKTGRNESNLRKTLENSKYIHYELIYKISEALEVDLFAYGSQKLKEKINIQ